MPLILTEEQTMLRDMAREWVDNESPVSAFRKMRNAGVPEGYDVETHFTPRYNPWDQRLCLILSGDFYEAIAEGHTGPQVLQEILSETVQ